LTLEATAENGIRLSLIIPVYNEKDAIAATIEEAIRVLGLIPVSSEIIVVNDGSVDGTREVLEGMSGAQVVHHPTNTGYGAAIKTGLRYSRGQWIAITDADGTYPLERLPDLWEKTTEVDMVVGARPKSSLPMIRRPAKWFIQGLANFVAQTAIPDFNSGFRLFRADLLRRYFSMLPDGFSLTTTMTLAMHSDGYRVEYVSIEYHKRKGKSKIHPLWDPYNFIILIMRMCLYFNPLRVFGPLSLAFFVLGTGVFVYSKFFTPQVMDITVTVLYFVCVQMLVLGMLGDLVVRRSRG